MQKIVNTIFYLVVTGVVGILFLSIAEEDINQGNLEIRNQVFRIEFDGIIEKIEVNRNGEYLSVRGGQKNIKFYSCRNNEGFRFSDLAEVGDSVYKYDQSFDLYLEHENKSFIFKIC